MQQSNTASNRRARVSVFVERKPFVPFNFLSVKARIRRIDTSANKWLIGEAYPIPIDFNRIHNNDSPLLRAIIHQIKFYVARELPRKSPSSILGIFESILRFLNSFEWLNLEGETVADVLAENLMFYIHINRTFRDESNLNALRSWYHRSYVMGLPDFSQEAAQALSTFRFKGHLKGEDVLSSIPHAGPLSAQELEALKQALNEFEPHIHSSDRIYPWLICIWLFISLGIRGQQAALLMRSDFAVHVDEITGKTTYILNVPSVKKRYQIPRTYFKQRTIPTFLGEMLDAHLKFKCSQKLHGRNDENTPIFPLTSLRRRNTNVVSHDYLQTHSGLGMTTMIKNLLVKLNIHRMAENKLPLNIRLSARRLRKTFATKAAALGVPIVELAELLDHEDLQHVMVYYKLGLEFSEKLDRVMEEQYKDILTYFRGEISLKALVDKSLPNTVFGPDRLRRLVGIGMCAKGAPCNLTPPNACYVCPKFEACDNSDIHREVLETMQSDIKYQFGDDAPPGLINAPHILACKQLLEQLEKNHE
jgi:integrase